MEIQSAEAARAWLVAWGGRPRRGVLWAAVAGLRACVGLTPRSCPQLRAAYAAALAVLEAAQARRIRAEGGP